MTEPDPAASERPPVDPQAWFRLGSFVHSLTPTKTLTQEKATELYGGLVSALDGTGFVSDETIDRLRARGHRVPFSEYARLSDTGDTP